MSQGIPSCVRIAMLQYLEKESSIIEGNMDANGWVVGRGVNVVDRNRVIV